MLKKISYVIFLSIIVGILVYAFFQNRKLNNTAHYSTLEINNSEERLTERERVHIIFNNEFKKQERE